MRFFAATHSAVILRCEGAIAPSLEGWPQAPAFAAILRGPRCARAPQDDGVLVASAARSGVSRRSEPRTPSPSPRSLAIVIAPSPRLRGEGMPDGANNSGPVEGQSQTPSVRRDAPHPARVFDARHPLPAARGEGMGPLRGVRGSKPHRFTQQRPAAIPVAGGRAAAYCGTRRSRLSEGMSVRSIDRELITDV